MGHYVVNMEWLGCLNSFLTFLTQTQYIIATHNILLNHWPKLIPTVKVGLNFHNPHSVFKARRSSLKVCARPADALSVIMWAQNCIWSSGMWSCQCWRGHPGPTLHVSCHPCESADPRKPKSDLLPRETLHRPRVLHVNSTEIKHMKAGVQ